MTQSEPVRVRTAPVPFGEAFRVWCRIAALSFGGPAGQIAVMHRLLVQEKRWLSENRFLHALNYCMLLPGPEAQQLATYSGWLLHRWVGGLVAGLLFVLPGFVSILVLSILYARFQDLGAVEALFFGLKPAVMAIVVQAVMRIGKRALRNHVLEAFAAAAFVAIFFFQVPFPLVVVAAALAGVVGGRLRPELFLFGVERDQGSDEASAVRPLTRRTLGVVALWLVIWLAPVAALVGVRGSDDVFSQIGVFFSTASTVTFGGAYAVLAFVAQQAVEAYGWLRPGEMLDGLGMAETTPGPLIQVVQFVGFMGAFRQATGVDPIIAGILGSVLTTWVTFAPCFLWIFAGAPYIEYLRGRKALTAGLTGITAAVVGVILNLAVWFSLHTLFASVTDVRIGAARLLVPVWESLDVMAAAIAAGAFVLVFRLRWGMIPTLAAAVVAGLAARFLL